MEYAMFDVMTHDDTPEQVETLLAAPDLAEALESEQFRRFLDQIPIAIVIAELKNRERIAYANPEFERLSGQKAKEIEGKAWTVLPGQDQKNPALKLGTAIAEGTDRVGTFLIEKDDETEIVVDVFSNVIEDEDGTPVYRLAALVDIRAHTVEQREELEKLIRDKDTLLREIQHRVKNNLQMITTLIRLEARNVPAGTTASQFDRLAGRIEALQLLYQSLSDDGGGNDQIDLGVYLSLVASSVMRAHAVEGIRLDLQVDTYPVSVNVAMPAGLVVNELLTNALKHAFKGRDGGTITLHSLADEKGCEVIVRDDGVGLPPDVQWPARGKLGALIVKSLRENAKATLDVESTPDKGVCVTITFTRAAAAPETPLVTDDHTIPLAPRPV
jgi:PAS domain S-box-containing protein